MLALTLPAIIMRVTAMASNRLRVDARGLNAIKDIRKRIEASAVSIGVHEGQHRGSDKTVAQVYAFNEFGTETIPERPTLRPTFAKEKIKYRLTLGKIVGKAMEEPTYDIHQAMGKIGLMAQNDLQNAIRTLDAPPNADSTISKKGSSNPLIDTGQLVNSVKWDYAKPIKKGFLQRLKDSFS